MWRPLLEGVITYTEMKQLYDDELMEINKALDIYIEAQNKK